MIQLTITTSPRRATITETELLTSGSYGIQCEFSFTEDWAGLQKLAVFRAGDDGDSIDVSLDDDNRCYVPYSVLKEAGEVLFIGVYGSDGTVIRIPTIWASAGVVKQGVLPATQPADVPPENIWAQISADASFAKATSETALTKSSEAVETANAAYAAGQQYAESAAASAVTASEQAGIAEGFANHASDFASSASDSASDASDFADSAEESKEASENWSKESAAWATGSYTGDPTNYPVPAGSAQENNNAYYYSDQARIQAEDASNSAGDAETAQQAAETAQEAAEAAQAAIEEMFPTGGTVGQYLRKQSDTDYDSEWADLPVAEEFNADSVYFEGDYCLHNGDLYRCKIPRGSGTAWNDNHWDKITVADDLNGALGSIAVFWERQAMYNTGAFVVYKGHLYRCKTDNVQAEPTNTTYWEAANLANKLDSKVDKVNGKGLSTNDYTTVEKDKLANLSAGDVAFNKESGYLSGTVGRYLQLLNSEDVQYTYGGEKELGTVGETLDYLADKSVEIGEDVDDLKNTLNHKADVIYDTASGYIASFPDGADGLPVKDLTVGIEPVQSGTGDPSPTNVRPISGWTGCNVTRTGKNLLDMQAVVLGAVDDTGAVISNANNKVSALISCLPSTVYTISGFTSGVRPKYYISPESYIGQAASTTIDSFTTPDNCHYFRLQTGKNYWNDNCMVELGSIASAFEPYQGNTIPITFPTGAGTVYGGTLDVTSGVLTVDRAGVDMGTMDWTYASTNNVFYAECSGKAVGRTNFICSEYKVVDKHYTDLLNGEASGVNTTGATRSYINVKNDSYTDAETFTTAMSGQIVVYELATPIVIQLDPATVETLLGQNNIWADCGPSTVEYPCDTKLYIQKINTPTDDDMIADANIASGQYFIVNNNLYLSTAAILAGDPIKPGTNCTLTNLAAALNALNS